MKPPPRKQNSIVTGQMILCQFSVCLKNHVYLKRNSFNAFKHVFGGTMFVKNKSTLVPKLCHRPMSSPSSFLLEVLSKRERSIFVQDLCRSLSLSTASSLTSSFRVSESVNPVDKGWIS